MKALSELARRRIVGWMSASPHITQTTIAHAVGVSQAWVSMYKTGDQDADVDQLEAIARVFGHTLTELFDLRADPNEQRLLTAYRSLPEHKRSLACLTLEGMLPDPPRKKTRSTNKP